MQRTDEMAEITHSVTRQILPREKTLPMPKLFNKNLTEKESKRLDFSQILMLHFAFSAN